MRLAPKYRLRHLLICTAIVCLGITFYGSRARQHSAEQNALSGIDRLNERGHVDQSGASGDWWAVGHVEFESQLRGGINNLLKACDCDVFDRVSKITLSDDGFDDRVVPHLLVFRSLKTLSLNRTRISANGLRKLRVGLPNTVIKVVDPRDREIPSPIRSRIQYLESNGATVKRGDVLVELDTSELRTERKCLLANIEQASSNNLLADVEDALSNERQLKHLDELIRKCTIRAPMDGIVRYWSRGQIELNSLVRERQNIVVLEPIGSLTTHDH